MMSEMTFRGGALYRSTASNYTIGRDAPRFITDESSGGTRVYTLPGGQHRGNETGPTFYVVYAKGSATVELRDIDGTLIDTLTTGQVAKCHYVGGKEWYTTKRSVNTARTAHTGTYVAEAAPASETDPPFRAACIQGTLCEIARAEGNRPLDGNYDHEGRPLCLAPLFQDNCLEAGNQEREPIRGADLVMPSVVPVLFPHGEYVEDPAHPLHGSITISQKFWKALSNNDLAHALKYDSGTTHHGTSRHWHHMRQIQNCALAATPIANHATAWSMVGGNPSVKRHVWYKTIPYTSDDGTATYNLHIRFVMEHLINPEPLLVHPENGGANPYTTGAWGAVFHIYVFTDELSHSFADGNSFTPAGASAPVTFTKDDPCVWGNASGVAQGAAKKFCHPQMVLCASLPTTMEAPCGKLWVPLAERKFLRDIPSKDLVFKGQNRETSYEVDSDLPWNTGCASRSRLGGLDAFNNQTFGKYSTTNNAGFMTRGGSNEMDWGDATGPRDSRPMNYMCYENGLAEGRTYLVPASPGWDELCGTGLTGDFTGDIAICTENKDGSTEGTSRRWPSASFSPCHGHPANPCVGGGGSGGTHGCFSTSCASNVTHPDVACCTTAMSSVQASCSGTGKYVVTYDDLDAGGYPIGMTMYEHTTYHRDDALLDLENYSFQFESVSANRSITWGTLQPQISTWTLRDYTYSSSDVADLIQSIGTWTLGSTITISAVAGTDPARALLIFNQGSGTPWYGFVLTCEIDITTSSGKTGIGMGSASGGVHLDGWGVVLQRTSTTNLRATLKKYNGAGTATTLSTTDINVATGAARATITWTAHGNDLTVRVAGDAPQTDIVYNGAVTTAQQIPALYTESTSSPASTWYSVSVRETVWPYTVAVTLGYDGPRIYGTWDPEVTQRLHGPVGYNYPADCTANCRQYHLTGLLPDFLDTRDISLAPGQVGHDGAYGDFPEDNSAPRTCYVTECGGLFPAPIDWFTYSAGQKPTAGVAFCAPPGCADATDLPGLMCSGAVGWEAS